MIYKLTNSTSSLILVTYYNTRNTIALASRESITILNPSTDALVYYSRLRGTLLTEVQDQATTNDVPVIESPLVEETPVVDTEPSPVFEADTHPLFNKTKKELQELADSLGLKYITRATKEDLVNLIVSQGG